MIWVWAILGALGAGFALRFLAITKIHVLKLQAKFQGKFFEYAHRIVDRDDFPDARLAMLSKLSSELRNRKSQLLVMEAIRNGMKRDEQGISRVREINELNSDLNAEQKSAWTGMYFRWLIATCAQGSIMGVGALVKALEYFDPDDPENLPAAIPNFRPRLGVR